MLCGMITKDIINLQQLYYHHHSSLRSANRWATDLIKFFWNVLHSLWIQRNEALHKETSIYKNSRRVILSTSITQEYNRGSEHLPQTYSPYFKITLPSLLTKPTKYLKRWFLIVRSARESSDLASPSDIFSYNGPLRSWINLKRKPK